MVMADVIARPRVLSPIPESDDFLSRKRSILSMLDHSLHVQQQAVVGTLV
jgi:hypothetical protein